MEAAKHTPGPWQWDSGVIPPDGPGTYADIYTDAGETIIASFNNLIPQGLANARLMAAAPDLLAACRIAAKAELYDPTTGIIDADVLEIVQDVARAAIAKATGRAPLKMLVDSDWLSRKVETDPDLDCEATSPSTRTTDGAWDCPTCGGNGKLWNGLLGEYRPCIDCQDVAL